MEILEKGKPYLVLVSNVRRKDSRPSYTKNNETWYNFLLDIELKDGKTTTVEYTSRRDVCEVFEPKVWQYIMCINPSEKGCLVEPYDPEGATTKPECRPTLKDVYNDIKDQRVEQSAYSVKVGGESAVFCFAWAKDLMVAEIAKRPEGSVVTDEDVEKVARWADILNEQLTNRIKF